MGNPFIAAALRNLADLHILAKSPKFDDQMNFVKMCDTLRLQRQTQFLSQGLG